MKSALHIIAIVLLGIVTSPFAVAQSQSTLFNNFGKLTISDGLFIPVNAGVKEMNVSFPYSIADGSGKFVPAQFNSTIKKPFSSTLNCIGLSMEIDKHGQIFSFAVDASPVFTPKGMYQVALGYGRYWVFSKDGFSREPKSKGLFIVSASMSLAVMNRKQLVGIINNDSNDVTAFNKNIPANFDGGAFENDNNHYTAKEMQVFFRQTAVGLLPHVAISTTSKFCAELEFSYFLPFSESAAVNIYQHDGSGVLGDGYNLGAKSKLNQNGMIVTTDNNVANKAPFSLSSFQTKLKIGILAKN